MPRIRFLILKASVLIACTFTCYICVLTMQSMNQFVVPPILLREHCRYLLGKTEKVGQATVFFVLASSGLILSCI
jgi:hypothetical protein